MNTIHYMHLSLIHIYLESIISLNNVLKAFKGKVILDPILGDNGTKYSGATEEQIEFYKEFVKFADIVLSLIHI